MSKPATEDPQALAAIVTGLGGTVIPGSHFRFDLLQENVATVVPKLNALGLRVQRVGERVTDHPTRIRNQCTVVTLGLFKEPS